MPFKICAYLNWPKYSVFVLLRVCRVSRPWSNEIVFVGVSVDVVYVQKRGCWCDVNIYIYIYVHMHVCCDYTYKITYKQFQFLYVANMSRAEMCKRLASAVCSHATHVGRAEITSVQHNRVGGIGVIDSRAAAFGLLHV